MASSVFAENIQSSKTTPEESNNLQSVPIKIPESHNYSFADIVEALIPAVVNVYTVQYGKINRGRLGVVIQEVTNEIAEGFELKEASGALVVEVQKDGPADKFGIKPGDVIIEFAGQPVKNSRRLQIMVAETSVDQEVKIIVVHEMAKIKN